MTQLPPSALPLEPLAVPHTDPGAFALLARECAEQLANVCDAFSAVTEEPRFRDAATHLAHACLVLRELE